MRRLSFCLVMAVAVVAGGCTAPFGGDYQYDTVAPKPVSRHAHVRILHHDDRLTASGAQAFLLLRRGQTARNLAACTALIDIFGKPSADAWMPSPNPWIAASVEIPVFWLDARARKADASGAAAACASRVDNFDFDRADDITAGLTVKPGSPGPLLVALRQPGDVAYALDLATVPQDGLESVVARWHNSLLQDPALWDAKTLNAELLRQKMRYYLHSAADVVAVLIPMPTPAEAGQTH